MAVTTSRGIDLHINEIVVDGAMRGDRQRIAMAIQRELGRLFTEQGIPPSLTASRTLARVDGGKVRLTPGARPEAIGQQVARAIHRGLSKQ